MSSLQPELDTAGWYEEKVRRFGFVGNEVIGPFRALIGDLAAGGVASAARADPTVVQHEVVASG